MKPRKTHLKSRTGCATCRARRIKCDESKPQCINCTRRQVRCDFLGVASTSQTSPGEPSPQVARILHALSDNDADGSIEPEPASLLRFFPTETPDLSKQERFLMAHLCGISDDLVAAGMQNIDFGLSLLPEVHRIAVDCSFVRHSACALASTHLAFLTQASSMVHLAYYYKCLALRGLRESLRVLNQDNVDAMLAASYLLSWQASQRFVRLFSVVDHTKPKEEIAYTQHSQEFMQIMKGVDLALMEMENFGHQSKLRSLTQHSSKRIKLETSDIEHAPYPENNSIELACSTLRELQKQVGDEPELVRGTKELINFMQNLRISPPGPTADEQLQALYPIRHWVPWLPRSLISLSDREPLVLVFLAHYHMVVLAVESILPAAPNFLLASKRVELIERLETTIGQVYKPSEKLPKQPGTRRRRESLENLMSGPAAFARQFLLTNLLSAEPVPVWGNIQTATGDQGLQPQWQEDPGSVDFNLYR